MVEYEKYRFKSKEKPQYVKKKKKRYCLVCKKKTDNITIRGVALKNKIGQQKSLCINCDSKKSTFLKTKTVFTNYKDNAYLL